MVGPFLTFEDVSFMVVQLTLDLAYTGLAENLYLRENLVIQF